MENNPLYPPITKKQRRRQHLAYVLNRIFVTCVILSIIVNFASGGAPWCLIVIIGFFTLHTMVVSPDLLEYNRISQTIKAIILLSILFILIDLLYPGWAGVATSVLLCCGIVLSAALFFSDFRRQRENLFPFLWLLIVALARALTGVTSTSGPIRASRSSSFCSSSSSCARIACASSAAAFICDKTERPQAAETFVGFSNLRAFLHSRLTSNQRNDISQAFSPA